MEHGEFPHSQWIYKIFAEARCFGLSPFHGVEVKNVQLVVVLLSIITTSVHQFCNLTLAFWPIFCGTSWNQKVYFFSIRKPKGCSGAKKSKYWGMVWPPPWYGGEIRKLHFLGCIATMISSISDQHLTDKTMILSPKQHVPTNMRFHIFHIFFQKENILSTTKLAPLGHPRYITTAPKT